MGGWENLATDPIFQIIGGLSSIIGFGISIITLIVSARVNYKVNKALREREDTSFIKDNCPKHIEYLTDIRSSIANGDKISTVRITDKVYNAITIIERHIQLFFPHEGLWSKSLKKIEFMIKKRQLDIILNTNNSSLSFRENKKMLKLLSYFIFLLDKENYHE